MLAQRLWQCMTVHAAAGPCPLRCHGHPESPEHACALQPPPMLYFTCLYSAMHVCPALLASAPSQRLLVVLFVQQSSSTAETPKACFTEQATTPTHIAPRPAA